MDFVEFFRSGTTLFAATPNQLVWALAISAAMFIAIYTMQTIALAVISKREGYKLRWMAFLPFFNTFYIGYVSQKNRIFGKNPKYFSLALSLLELFTVAGYALYYVSFFYLLFQGYINYEPVEAMGITQGVLYEPTLLEEIVPYSLAWMAWCVKYVDIILGFIELFYVMLKVFVLIAFFQTYAYRKFYLLALFSSIFPIFGILAFFVRKNKGVNYREYIRQMQERQYRQYQQYYQQFGQSNPYNFNPYQNSTPPNPQEKEQREQPESNPFGDFNESKKQSPEQPQDINPFEDF